MAWVVWSDGVDAAGTAGAPGGAPPRLHGAGGVRGAGRAAAHPQRQGGPPRAPRARRRRAGRRRLRGAAHADARSCWPASGPSCWAWSAWARSDGFFALGGHSLLAMRVASRVRETLAGGAPRARRVRAPHAGRAGRRGRPPAPHRAGRWTRPPHPPRRARRRRPAALLRAGAALVRGPDGGRGAPPTTCPSSPVWRASWTRARCAARWTSWCGGTSRCAPTSRWWTGSPCSVSPPRAGGALHPRLRRAQERRARRRGGAADARARAHPLRRWRRGRSSAPTWRAWAGASTCCCSPCTT